MRKIICLLLVLVACLSFAGCDSKASDNTTTWPMVEVNSVYDIYGNLLQQTLYNECTKEFIMTEYKYSRQDGIWVCIGQNTTILNTAEETASNKVNNDRSINVYYESELTNCCEIVLMNNSDIKISIVEYLDKASWWEFGYKIKVENKSNKILTVMFDAVSIMDINCKPMFSIDHIDVGHTAYFNLAWDKDSLERAWIPYIDNVEFMVRVFDNEDWETPALYGTKVLIKK